MFSWLRTCVALAALVAYPWTTAAAQTEAEIEEQMRAILDNVKELEANLPRLEEIERQEAAMRELLNDKQDELESERARRAALEAQLRAWTADSTLGPASDDRRDAAAGTSGPSTRWLTLPPRRVNALGLLDTSATPVGSVPMGTEVLVPRWPRDAQLPDGVGWPRIETDGTQTRIVQDAALGSTRTLALLELRGQQVFWSWRGGASASPGGADAWIEPMLRRCVFEARRAGVPLAAYQCTPAERALPERLSLGSAVTLGLSDFLGVDPAMGAIALSADVNRTPHGWAVLSNEPDSVAWVSEDASFEVRRSAEGEALVIRRGPGVAARSAAVERQQRAWRRDTAGDTSATQNQAIQSQATQELTRLEAEAAELRALRERLAPASPLAAESVPFASGVADAPIVQVIDPTQGVVLARLSLTPTR